MFVCPELIEETGRFRKLIFGISGQNFPPSNKLRFPVEIFTPRQVMKSFPVFGKCENHIKPYNSYANRAKNLKLLYKLCIKDTVILVTTYLEYCLLIVT